MKKKKAKQKYSKMVDINIYFAGSQLENSQIHFF